MMAFLNNIELKAFAQSKGGQQDNSKVGQISAAATVVRLEML